VLKRAGEKRKVTLLEEVVALEAVKKQAAEAVEPSMKNMALNFIAKLVVKEAVLAGEKRKKKVMAKKGAAVHSIKELAV
jgi:hypothetical protein